MTKIKSSSFPELPAGMVGRALKWLRLAGITPGAFRAFGGLRFGALIGLISGLETTIKDQKKRIKELETSLTAYREAQGHGQLQ